MSDFEYALSENLLRSRRNAKWTVSPGVLPAPVAEMDFRAEPHVDAALRKLVDLQDFGYPKRHTERPEFTISEAFAGRMARLYDWQISAATIQPVTDLVQAKFAAIYALSKPGDGVIVQVPAYSPFFSAVSETGRTLLKMRMVLQGGQYRPDLDQLAELAPQARILTICNPHNPTGRVFTREELLAMAEIAIRHNLIILSDEIHSDIVFDGARHIPIASLSAEIAARTVTLNSPTKGFNIPGLRAGIMHFGTAELRARFHAALPRKMLGQISVFGIEAAVAAWTEGDDWLDGVMRELTARRDRLCAVLRAETPELILPTPEATYLAWVDCSALGLNQPAADFFRERCKVAFSGGDEFDPGHGESYIRINFATGEHILDRILQRTVDAVTALRT